MLNFTQEESFQVYELPHGEKLYLHPKQELASSYILTKDGRSDLFATRCYEAMQEGDFSLLQFVSPATQHDLCVILFTSLEENLKQENKKIKSNTSQIINPILLKKIRLILAQPAFQGFLKTKTNSFWDIVVSLDPSSILLILNEMGGPKALMEKVGLSPALYCLLIPTKDLREYFSKPEFVPFLSSISLANFLKEYFSFSPIVITHAAPQIFSMLKMAPQFDHLGKIVGYLRVLPNRYWQVYIETLGADFASQLTQKTSSEPRWFIDYLYYYIESLKHNKINSTNNNDISFLVREFISFASQFDKAILEYVFSNAEVLMDLFRKLGKPFAIPFLKMFSNEYLRKIIYAPSIFHSFQGYFMEGEVDEILAKKMGTEFFKRMHLEFGGLINKRWLLASVPSSKRLLAFKDFGANLKELKVGELRRLTSMLSKQDLREACEFVGIDYIADLIFNVYKKCFSVPKVVYIEDFSFLQGDPDLHIKIAVIALKKLITFLAAEQSKKLNSGQLDALVVLTSILENKLPIGCLVAYFEELLPQENEEVTLLQRFYIEVFASIMNRKFIVLDFFNKDHHALFDLIKELAVVDDKEEEKRLVGLIAALLEVAETKMQLKYLPRRFFQLLSPLSTDKIAKLFLELKRSAHKLKEDFGLSLAHYLMLINEKDWLLFLTKGQITAEITEVGILDFAKEFYSMKQDWQCDHYEESFIELKGFNSPVSHRFYGCRLPEINILSMVSIEYLEKEIANFATLLKFIAELPDLVVASFFSQVSQAYLIKLFTSAREQSSFTDLLQMIWNKSTREAALITIERMIDYVMTQVRTSYQLFKLTEFFGEMEAREKFIISLPLAYLQSVICKSEDLPTIFEDYVSPKVAERLTAPYLISIFKMNEKPEDKSSCYDKYLGLQWILTATPDEMRFNLLKSLISSEPLEPNDKTIFRWGFFFILQDLSRVNSILLLLPKNNLAPAYQFFNQDIGENNHPITMLISMKIHEKMSEEPINTPFGLLNSHFSYSNQLRYQLSFLKKDPILWRSVAINVLKLYIKRDTSQDCFSFFQRETNEEVLAVKAILRVLKKQQPLSHLQDSKYQKGIEKISNIIEFEDFIRPLLEFQNQEVEAAVNVSTGIRLGNRN